MKVLYIVRGLPGSGKTTLAETLSPHVFCADDYFTDSEGNYHFDPAELEDAHKDCQESVETAMGKAGNGLGWHTIAVANTFSQAWEADPYFKLAEKYNYSPFVVECQNNFQNTHNVPQETIDAMRMRWSYLYHMNQQEPIYVYVKGERVDEREVEVLNIEEDIQGRDLLTFKYKGKKYTSYRVE